jgi:hypothetical protein
MLTAVLTTVISATLITLILAVAKSRWLYLCIPQLNFPTALGHVALLTVKNAGLSHEEEVTIRLKAIARYELLGATKSTVTFLNNVLTVPRLGRFESIHVLLLVEQRPFLSSDVDAFESRATTGKVVGKPEEMVSPWLPALGLALALFFMVLFFSFGALFGKETRSTPLDFITEWIERLRPSKQLAGYRIDIANPYPRDEAFVSKEFAAGHIKFSIGEIVRRDEVLQISAVIGNETQDPLSVNVDAKSSSIVRGDLSREETSASDVYVGPSGTATVSLKVYLPESSPRKIIWLEYRIEGHGDRAIINQTVSL